MNFGQKILNILFSTRVTGLLLVLFSLAMATATFIENDYGTETAKALIYSAKWFEVIIVLLAINFIGNIPKYNLITWEKAPILLLHLAFIVIILGAGVTRYKGFEALVTIKEKDKTNRILSIDSYLQIEVGNQSKIKNFTSKPLFMSQLGFNSINEDFDFEDQKVSVKLKKYIPNASYKLVDTIHGNDYLHLVISKDEKRNDFYVKKGTRQNIYGISIAFDAKEKHQGEIFIKSADSTYMASFPEVTPFFSMTKNEAGAYKANTLEPLQFKALSQINDVPIVFNEVLKNKVKKLVQKPSNPKVKNPESAIVLQLTSGKKSKEVTLFGGAGYMNPFTTVFLNQLHFRLRYGSKPIKLPFNIGLTNFTLERYPGSSSPSAYYSDLQITDKSNTLEYQIFMNNVLDYKGYRFFQSAYLPDESGTILSVNHDYWGTKITYLGYFLLALGMGLSLLWNSPLFHFFSKSR